MSDIKMLWKQMSPKKLEHVILSPRLRGILSSGVHSDFLFYGSPGTGKTTVAKILADKYPHLYIDASTNSSVDSLRGEISDFCSTKSLIKSEDESIKVVILDEIEGVSDQYLKALRVIMETYTETTRFIATTNYINKIPESNRSRFELVSFDPQSNEESLFIRKEQCKRIHGVCKSLNITIDQDATVEFVKKNEPDLRNMYIKIQTWAKSGVTHVTMSSLKTLNWSYSDLYELLFSKSDSTNSYIFIRQNYESRIDDAIFSLGSDFIDWIKENKANYASKIPQIIIVVAKYQDMRSRVIDPLVNLLALIFELQIIING